MPTSLSHLNIVPQIEPELVAQELASGRRLVLVDVRSREECKHHGWIRGARRFPLHQLAGRRAELCGQEGAQIVVVSGGGIRAHAAVIALEVAGFSDVAVLAGGMKRWEALGLPMELETDIPSIRPPNVL